MRSPRSGHDRVHHQCTRRPGRHRPVRRRAGTRLHRRSRPLPRGRPGDRRDGAPLCGRGSHDRGVRPARARREPGRRRARPRSRAVGGGRRDRGGRRVGGALRPLVGVRAGAGRGIRRAARRRARALGGAARGHRREHRRVDRRVRAAPRRRRLRGRAAHLHARHAARVPGGREGVAGVARDRRQRPLAARRRAGDGVGDRRARGRRARRRARSRGRDVRHRDVPDHADRRGPNRRRAAGCRGEAGRRRAMHSWQPAAMADELVAFVRSCQR